ncbi:hypothetical protein [Sphingomonas sp. HMP6]|uniref:hypothetical protein n=1 Tax=Sphingomonas sp. HMP6 TaxID=1517551 RepID=UPI001596C45B|nr:hypothetical protein [Sphingomonas sp. HMP6]BCA58612.1 hypothetical protein HMP06_1381 [Sphingomonas sp. HMP6]
MAGLFKRFFAKRELLLTEVASDHVERIREMMTFLREECPGGWENAESRYVSEHESFRGRHSEVIS